VSVRKVSKTRGKGGKALQIRHWETAEEKLREKHRVLGGISRSLEKRKCQEEKSGVLGARERDQKSFKERNQG